MMSRLRSLAVDLATMLASLLALLLVAELVLRFLPVAWAPPVEPPTATDPIQRYAADRRFTWSVGWNFAVVVRGRTNAQGFVADDDYAVPPRRPLIAVVGDSYVEAMNVPFALSLTGRLRAMLGERASVYAFAMAGSPLSQYVAYAADACARYRPERLVVVIVGNDFDESLAAHRVRDGIHHLYRRADGTLDWRLTPAATPSLLERFARNSALALYLVRNVRIAQRLGALGISAARAQAGFVGNTPADASARRVAEGIEVIDWFLSRLPQAACLEPRDILLVLDAPRPEVYDAAALRAAGASYFGRMRGALTERARAAGFVVLDLAEPFGAAYARDRRPFNHSEDYHWDAHGHAVVAEAIRAALPD